MFQRILVPVDGSETSNAGLSEAIRLAGMTGGELRLVHALDPWLHANGFESPTTYCHDVLPRMRREGARILDQARAAAVAAGRRVTTVLVEEFAERVFDRVLAQARQWEADLIVIGSHGRRGLDRAFMGSDAEQVVRRSSMPVLIVHHRAALTASSVAGQGGVIAGSARRAPPTCRPEAAETQAPDACRQAVPGRPG
jgi:nucleotide-binding universal stress UspA family protein